MTTVTLDIETAGERLVCVGFAINDEPVETEEYLPAGVAHALMDPENTIVCHSKYDLRWLNLVQGVPYRAQLHDTMVMAWLIDETTPLDLQFVADRYLGIKLDKTMQKQVATADFADVAAYCAKDVSTTRDLYKHLLGRLDKEGLGDYFTLTEAPFTNVLLDMECRGLPVNLEDCKKLEDSFSKDRDAIERTLGVGLPSTFNPRSPQHVGLYLGSERFYLPAKVEKTEEHEVDQLLRGLSGEDTDKDTAGFGTFVVEKEGRQYDHGVWICEGLGPKGNVQHQLPSVNRNALLVGHQSVAVAGWVTEYLAWKKMDKLISTYLRVFPKVAKDGRIFGRFNQTGTVTGRLSSSEPNLQNIPARGDNGEVIRKLFQAPRGCDLIVGDFAQLEPRLMAHFSQDPVMVDAFQQDRDIYQVTADLVGCTRHVAKVLVLAMGYGAGSDKLAEILTAAGFPTTGTRARVLLRTTQDAYRVYFEWREMIVKEGERKGFVTTLDGRRRHIKTKNPYEQGKLWSWKEKDRASRQAANAVVQGSAADVVRRTMLHTTRLFPDLRLLAQVHDELVWEYDKVPTHIPDLVALRTWTERIAGSGLSVPLKFEPHFGGDWFTAKEG